MKLGSNGILPDHLRETAIWFSLSLKTLKVKRLSGIHLLMFWDNALNLHLVFIYVMDLQPIKDFSMILTLEKKISLLKSITKKLKSNVQSSLQRSKPSLV